MKSEPLLIAENGRASEPVASERVFLLERALRLLERCLVYAVCEGFCVVAGTTVIAYIDSPVMERLHE